MKRLNRTTISLTPQIEADVAELQSYTGEEKSVIVRNAMQKYLKEELSYYRQALIEKNIVLGLEEKAG